MNTPASSRATQAGAHIKEPTNDEILAEMLRQDPHWNAYGASRSSAVWLAIGVFRDLRRAAIAQATQPQKGAHHADQA